MTSSPSRHCTVELEASPVRISQVRRIITARLRYWHLDMLIEATALGLTELLSNVHRHAEPDKHCTVELTLLTGALTVSVHDADPRPPLVREAAPLAGGGRGLPLVAAMSESWGYRPRSGGKSVWFTLPAPRTAAPRPRTPHGEGARR